MKLLLPPAEQAKVNPFPKFV
jgi:hypothetical protein